MAMERYRAIYLFLGLVFFLLTLGPKATITLMAVLIAFIIGFAVCLIYNGYERRTRMRASYEDWIQNFHFGEGLPFAIDNFPFSDESIYSERHSMTNSELLDPILEEILENIMHDYVDSWYNVNLTSDKLFQASLKRMARRSVVAFGTCLDKVDWLTLLTRHIVDDFASHLRLYRKAKELQMQKVLESTEKCRPSDDLESLFFDLELEMERSCRDLVSTSPAYESAYLHDICDILFYLLMPSEDFRCRPLRFLIREVFVTKIFVPLLDKLSDPSFVNRMIVWLLSELPISTDNFVTSLNVCKSVQELEAILESVHDEMNTLKSKGVGDKESNGGSIFTQQLSSLEFTENLIRQQMVLLANKSEQIEKQLPMIQKNFTHQKEHCFEFAEDASLMENDITLPITVVLTHPTAITHFVEYLNHVGGQNYIDFYLAIEGFKSSMEHQNRGLNANEMLDSDAQETLREAALFMYHQYLSQEAITRVPLDDLIINKFLARLRNDAPSDMWFEQIQQKIVHILCAEERFYPNFKRHKLYIKMLEELGIGVGPLEYGDDAVLIKPDEIMDEIDLTSDRSTSSSDGSTQRMQSQLEQNNKNDETNSTMVFIEMLGVGHQGRHMFALYNVRANERGGSSSNVIRRYSDFYALNNLILTKFPKLRTLNFPGKRAFNNLDRNVLEKRCKALNQYMNCILQPSLLAANPGLEQIVFDFLSQKNYTGKESFPKTMSTMFNPIVSGVKAFGNAAASMPSDLIDGIGKMGSELNRAAGNILKGNSTKQKLQRNRPSSASTGNLLDSSRVAAHIDENDSAENIPLRVLLLLVDEVFGLRAKNQWFRRRLASLLRQFINATLGNSINRRIIDAVQWLTSEEQVAQYLIALRDTLWGDSTNVSEQRPQQHSQRFLARYLMLSAVPDQLRLFIGNTTIQAGVENVSEALQNRHLNRRFWYVILERLLVTIFPHNRFDRLFLQLHSKSPRMQME